MQQSKISHFVIIYEYICKQSTRVHSQNFSGSRISQNIISKYDRRSFTLLDQFINHRKPRYKKGYSVRYARSFSQPCASIPPADRKQPRPIVPLVKTTISSVPTLVYVHKYTASIRLK